MKNIFRLRWKLGAILTAAVGILFFVTQARANRPFETPLFSGQPERISLTGNFYRPDEKVRTGSHVLRIHINDKETWVFDIREARDLTGLEPGLSLVDHLTPSTLTFWGPKKLLASLEKPDLDKKVVTIEGYLYEAYNILEVTAIRNIP